MKLCDVRVVNISQFMILAEIDDGEIHRRYIPRELVPGVIHKNQPAQIPCDAWQTGIEYSDVVLSITLGNCLNDTIQASEVEQAMRRAGLWLREDYRNNMQIVAQVLTANNWRKALDPTTVVNAALLDYF